MNLPCVVCLLDELVDTVVVTMLLSLVVVTTGMVVAGAGLVVLVV